MDLLIHSTPWHKSLLGKMYVWPYKLVGYNKNIMFMPNIICHINKKLVVYTMEWVIMISRIKKKF